MSQLNELKARICKSVGDLEKTLLAVSHSIHARPELSFQEHHASALLCDTLRAEGLDVEGGAYGLETAFEANLGSGDGPCVAILAEYDALPGIGHACGHNLIATSALGAVLALERLGAELPGRIRLLGTPAEETGGGKELMARKGALDGVDVALMVHPSSVNLVTMPCIAFAEINVRYTGRAAHASAMPERGINALDAIVTAYQALGALRQHIGFKERIHGIITDGGQAPNVVPEHAAGCFYVRAASREELEVLKGRAMACFEAGARATGATLQVEWGEVDYLDIWRNTALEQSFRRNAEELGREFVPVEALPPSVAGSTDMGNVSQRVPSIHPMLAAAPIHCTIHNAEFAVHARAPSGDHAALDGAKALAMTALDVLCDAEILASAVAEFRAQEASAS